MSIPLLRIGSDIRPFDRWEFRYRWVGRAVVIAVLLDWAVARLLLLPILALADAMASAVLPTRLRVRLWDRYSSPHPGKGPACAHALSLREGQSLSPVYEAECTECSRAFRWINGGTFPAILGEIEDQRCIEPPHAT